MALTLRAASVRPAATVRASRAAPRTAVVAQAAPLKKAAAAVTGAVTLLAAHPAFALVDDRLAGEGTGRVLGVSGLEGWAIPIVFGLVWSLYYAATRELGGDKGDDSGLTL